jgi:hypothetical protein
LDYGPPIVTRFRRQAAGFVYEKEGRKRTGFWGLRGLRNVRGVILRPLLFSTTWPASFLGSFFPQLRIFNNFSALFWVRLGLFFGADPLFSITSRVRFSKNYFFVPHNFIAKVVAILFSAGYSKLRVHPDCAFAPPLTRLIHGQGPQGRRADPGLRNTA